MNEVLVHLIPVIDEDEAVEEAALFTALAAVGGWRLATQREKAPRPCH